MPKTLAEWMKDKGRKASSLLSKRTGKSRAAIYLYRDGKRIPPADVMRKTYLATAGEVEPNDFYDLPRLAPKERRARESERLIILSRRHLPPDLHRQVMAALDVSDAGQAAA